MAVCEVITIDGPVGVGKSSVARNLAKSLGYRHVDTGAMYRAVTLAAMQRNIDLHDEAALTTLTHRCEIQLLYHQDSLTVLLDGKDVTKSIRSPEVSKNTSSVADTAGVREKLVSLQRALGLKGPSILEGRDISTVVFPDAFWKFYLVASLEERTRRRVLQLQEAGNNVDSDRTREDIRRRDTRDRSRSFGPLRIAPDAIIIDTTSLTEEEVIRLILAFVHTMENQSG